MIFELDHATSWLLSAGSMEQLKGRAWLEVRMWVVHNGMTKTQCQYCYVVLQRQLNLLTLAAWYWLGTLERSIPNVSVHWGWLTNSWLSWDELGPFSLQASYLVKLLQYYQHTGNTIYHDQGFAASEVNPSIVPILSFHKWWEEPQKRETDTHCLHMCRIFTEKWCDQILSC